MTVPSERSQGMKSRLRRPLIPLQSHYQPHQPIENYGKGWNPSRGAFVQDYGSEVLDASNLLMPLVFFMAPNDPRMFLLRQRELEHDQLPRRQLIELFEDRRFEQRLGLGFFLAVNIHFRLDDRHEAGGDNLPSQVDLLLHDTLDSRHRDRWHPPQRDCDGASSRFPQQRNIGQAIGQLGDRSKDEMGPTLLEPAVGFCQPLFQLGRWQSGDRI